MTYQIAYVKTNQELSFRDWLMRHEIECYLPVSKIQVKPRGKRSKIFREYPVFPHYAYVSVNDRLHELLEYTSRHAHGFMNWLQFGSNDVCTLRECDIVTLREREASGEFDKIAKAPGVVFQAGIPVKVLSGPLAGFTGIVRRGPKRQAIAKVEINGKIFDVPIVILAIVT